MIKTMLIANQNLIRGQTTGGPHREGAADNFSAAKRSIGSTNGYHKGRAAIRHNANQPARPL